MWRVLVLTGLSVVLYSLPAAATQYDVLYVKPGGDDSKNCGSVANACKTIGHAVDNARVYKATTIKVAQGEYTEQIYISGDNLPASSSEKLSIEGGWSVDFTTQSHDPETSRVVASGNNAIVAISPDIWKTVSLRLAYLTFQGTADLQRIGLQAYASSQNIVNLTLEHCRILSFRGNGIVLGSDQLGELTAVLHDNVIQGNYQFPASNSWSGAGLYISAWNHATVDVTLTNNTIANNQGASGGGAYLFANGAELKANLVNNIIVENRCEENGSAIYAGAGEGGQMDIASTNNTVNWNWAENDDGALVFETSGTGQIGARFKNTIVWGNGAAEIRMNRGGTSTLAVTTEYSIIGQVTNNGGNYTAKSSNVTADPYQPLLDARYHLLNSVSPAKDKGICGLNITLFGVSHYTRIAPYDDIDGDSRPGSGITTGCDIGADEYRFPWILFNPAFTKPQ